eukprot:6189504-Pleurochrysis_carterae.AAC.3
MRAGRGAANPADTAAVQLPLKRVMQEDTYFRNIDSWSMAWLPPATDVNGRPRQQQSLTAGPLSTSKGALAVQYSSHLSATLIILVTTGLSIAPVVRVLVRGQLGQLPEDHALNPRCKTPSHAIGLHQQLQ